MKKRVKHITLALLCFTTSTALAVKVKVDVNNTSGQHVTIKWAVYKKGMAPSEDDLLNNKNYGQFVDLFTELPSDSIDYSQTLKLEDDGIFVVVGTFRLGGRTSNSVRKDLSTLKNNDAIRFDILEPLNPIYPSLDFKKFKDQIPESLHGQYTDLIKQSIFGSFLLVTENDSGTYSSVIPLIPSQETIEVRYTKNGYNATDVFSHKIVSNIDFDLPGLPVAFKAALATKSYAEVTCHISNSGKVDIIPKQDSSKKDQSYYDLFLSISDDDMQIAKSKYGEDPDRTKLLLIISANVIDSISYSSKELKQLDVTSSISASVVTATGNYSILESSTQLSWQTKKVGKVNIRDFSDYIKNEIEKDRLKEINRNEELLVKTYNDMLVKYPGYLKKGLTESKEIKSEIEKATMMDFWGASNGKTVLIDDSKLGALQATF